MAEPTVEPAPRRFPGLAPLPLIVAAAFFMEALDGTVVITALPQIGASFGAEAASLGLTVTAYMVTLAVVVPASGWIADRFGARRVFVGAIALFTLASALCGLAPNLTLFNASRVLQGAAAALMSPVGRLQVVRSTPKRDLVAAIAAITWPGLIAPVLGPPLGGFLATYASWRWIFFLNVPLGLAGAWLAWRYTPDHREPKSPPFDVTGFLLTAVALGGLIYGLDLLGQPRASRWLAGALAAISCGFGVVAVAHARRAAQPMLDLRAMRWPTFRSSSVTSGFLARIAISGTPFLIPLLFQLGFGYTAFEAGLMVLVYMAGNLAMKTVTTPILRRFGFRRVLVGANAVTAAALLACLFLAPTTPKPFAWVVLFTAGLSRSMTFTGLNTLTFADVPPQERSGATALYSMLQQLSMSLGVAVAALMLNIGLALWRDAEPMLAEFRLAFACLAAVALAAAVGFARLHAEAGAEVSGHRAGGRPT